MDAVVEIWNNVAVKLILGTKAFKDNGGKGIWSQVIDQP